MESIKSGNLAQFKKYISEQPFRLFKNSSGYTPLETACIYGKVDIVTYILSLDKRLCYSSQPIRLACEHGHVEVVHVLIQHGSIIDPSVMIQVIQNGHTNMVRALIDHGISVNCSINGISPLSAAVFNRHESIVRLLIETPKLDFTRVVNTLWTALIHGYLNIATLLLNSGKFDSVKESSILRDILLYNPPHVHTAIQMLLTFGCNPNFGASPLEMACREYDISMVKLFLEFGAHVNLSDMFSNSPMVSSIVRNRVDLVELLLQHGADVNTTNINKIPVLHLSCNHGHLPMVKMLIANGATITTYTLIDALRGKDVHTIYYILQQGVNEQEFTSMKVDVWLASCGSPALMEFMTPILLMFPLSTLEDALHYVGNGLDLYTWEQLLSPSLKLEWPLFIQEANQTARACYMTLYESPDTMFRFRLGEEVEFSNAPIRGIMRPYGARPIRNRVVHYLVHPYALRRLL